MVRQFDRFGVRNKGNRVVPDDVATPHGMNADRARRTLAGIAAAAQHGHIIKILAARISHCLTELQCRARRRIQLVAMMRLGDFDVPGTVQIAGGLPGELSEDIDTNT